MWLVAPTCPLILGLGNGLPPTESSSLNKLFMGAALSGMGLKFRPTRWHNSYRLWMGFPVGDGGWRRSRAYLDKPDGLSPIWLLNDVKIPGCCVTFAIFPSKRSLLKFISGCVDVPEVRQRVEAHAILYSVCSGLLPLQVIPTDDVAGKHFR